MNRKLLLTGLSLAAMSLSASPAQGGEATANADPLASIIREQNPYHPGETLAIHKNLPTDCWPQLANTPQRTNYTPMKFAPPQGRKKWSVCLTDLDIDNRVNATVQPIIAAGRVYVGCKNGKLFALDAKSGEVRWTFQAGGPICHTAGYAKGRVMLAALDGCVYAVSAATGQQEWVFSNRSDARRRHGFSTAVLLAGDRLFAVDRGGRLFALGLADGKEIWYYDAGAPVDQSPAYDDGKVFFASEDMRVHAVRAADGTPLWRSKRLAGLSFRWFHPVVAGGMVIVRSQANPGITDNTDPAQRSLFALDEETGKESVVLKQRSQGHDGTQPPPAVTRDGLLIVQWCIPVRKELSKSFSWVLEDPVFWVLEDPKTQEIVMPLLETEKRPPHRHIGQYSRPWHAGLWTPNENSIVSVIGEMVMTAHPVGLYSGGRRPLGGAFELATRRWYVDLNGALPDGDGQGPGGWVSYGADGNESGGSDAMSAAYGLLYHHAKRCHVITCYEPMQSPAAEKNEKP